MPRWTKRRMDQRFDSIKLIKANIITLKIAISNLDRPLLLFYSDVDPDPPSFGTVNPDPQSEFDSGSRGKSRV